MRPLNHFDVPSIETPEDEADRERRWAFFEIECRDFAVQEPDGFAAVIRAVARAMLSDRS